MIKTLFFLFTLCGCIFLVLAIFPIRERDYTIYEKLVKSSNPDTHESNLTFSQQKREKVCKQVWYQDTQPLYFRIDSDESELFFFKQHHRTEIIEQLFNVICLMQEELYYDGDKPMQKVRYLEAKRASYNYTSHLFIAEDAHLWKYQLEGHEPPKCVIGLKSLMQATAHSVEFTLKGDKLNFVAHQMKATINSKEKSL